MMMFEYPEYLGDCFILKKNLNYMFFYKKVNIQIQVGICVCEKKIKFRACFVVFIAERK